MEVQDVELLRLVGARAPASSCAARWGRAPSRRDAARAATSARAWPTSRESPLANSVTSWPSATSSSVSQETTRSVPPYSFGGIASVSGAICAIRMQRTRFAGPIGLANSGQHANQKHPLALNEDRQRRFPWKPFAGLCVAVGRATLQHLLQVVTIGEWRSAASRATRIHAEGIKLRWTIFAATPIARLHSLPATCGMRPWSPCRDSRCRARRRRLLGHARSMASSFWSTRWRDMRRAAAASGSPSSSWCRLIAADNLLWRVASWIASYAFVGVTGDLRRDLFRHLTGHAPSYFADRLPGMLTSRITATSNAVFTVENMFIWNVLPPCVATVGAIAFVADRQRADGRRADRGCRSSWWSRCSASPPPASRCITISPTRPRPSTARWST